MDMTQTVIAALRAHLSGSGTLLLPGDPGYAAGRAVWNAGIDRHPAGILVCGDAEDVALAVRIAANHGVAVTVRGGGHNVAGRSLADGALLLDLSRMRRVEVNADKAVATAQGGACWHDMDTATQQLGLATTGGMISSTGVGGLTLGGGAGWLMRRHGLASDNLKAADVVLADSRIVRASAEEHPDLFWALRGGAGGLGVVTNFEFRIHPLTQVLAGLVIRPATAAGQVLREFRDFTANAPDEFCCMTVLAHAPPLPFLDPKWHGQPVVISAMCWCGDLATGARVLEPLRQFGAPLAEHVGPMPYLNWQHALDPSAPPGRYHYWKTANFAALEETTIDTLAAAATELPTAQSEIHVQHLGGAVARVPAGESAFSNRGTPYFVNLIGITPSLAQFADLRESVRTLHGRLARQALPGLLPNFSNQDDGAVASQFDTAHAQRLGALRRQYDGAGLFALV